MIGGATTERFWSAVQGLGVAEQARRRRRAVELLRRHDVTYNLHGDPEDSRRPWPLDLAPLIIEEGDWAELERGVEQRARVLEALLADLHGPGRVVEAGILSDEAVRGSPYHLRPMRGATVAGGRWLAIYACDVARDGEGRWVAVEDRCQAPSGMGYALENRIVVARTLPELFKDAHIRRLAPFVAACRDMLAALAPEAARPRIVFWTPGPYNETYFEQAYLARYLGLTLVEGSDLAIHDHRVVLKTLGGLEPVDVILRRVDDGFADPAAFRAESTLGLPGLAVVAHAGAIALANPLGSGLAEDPTLTAPLDAIARLLIGEGLSLGRHEASEERSRIGIWPEDEGGPGAARPAVLRVFAVARPGGGFAVMPGGFVRTASGAEGPRFSMQHGSLSKDCWVVASQAELALPPRGDGAAEIRSGADDLPSRVADNLFWLGRYAERTDGLLRALRIAATRLAESAPEDDLAPVDRALVALGAMPAGLGVEDFEARVLAALADPAGLGGFADTTRRLKRVVTALRYRLAPDMLRILDQFYALARRAPTDRQDIVEALGYLDRLVTAMAAFSGIELDSMTRGQGWRFLDAGRRLERLIGGAAILGATLAGADGTRSPTLDRALELMDSVLTYRSRYANTAQFAPALHLLLIDETNPRGIAYQAAALVQHVDQLPRHAQSGGPMAERALAQQAVKLLRSADLVHLGKTGPEGRRNGLASLLGELAISAKGISDALTRHFFGQSGMESVFNGR